MNTATGPSDAPPNFGQVESDLQAAESKAEALQRAVQSLPRVDEDGHSDCPFAEELYAKKDKLQEELQGLVERLQSHHAAIEKEIARIKNNMVVISAQQDQLHGDRPREHFSEAEAELAALYKRYVRLRDRVADAIEAVLKVLSDACSKQYPGGKPRENPWAGEGDPGPGQEPLIPRRPPGGADQELEDLFEMDSRRKSRGPETPAQET